MISEAEYGAFLDLAYDAAVDPQGWPAVIARYADLIGGAKAWMPSLNMTDGGGEGVLARIDPDRQVEYFDYYAKVNPFITVDEDPVWRTRISTDEDAFPKEAFLATEYYNDFLRPQEIHSVAIIRLMKEGPVETTLNVTRPAHKGQFSQGELATAAVLQPHLIRALALSRRLAVESRFAHNLVDVLDHSAHGIFLLDADGVVRHANREAQRLLARRDAVSVTGGRLAALAGGAARTLEALLRRAATGEDAVRSGGSMLLPRLAEGAPLSVTVAPLRSERSAGPFGPWVLVCVTDLGANLKLPQEALRDLFGLTPAEARVALALFEGASPREAGEMLGVSFATARNQIMRVFEKTGTHRQADLVRLMMRVLGIGGLSSP